MRSKLKPLSLIVLLIFATSGLISQAVASHAFSQITPSTSMDMNGHDGSAPTIQQTDHTEHNQEDCQGGSCANCAYVSRPLTAKIHSPFNTKPVMYTERFFSTPLDLELKPPRRTLS